MAIDRYEVRKGSQSGHCCFEATVVDTSQPEMIGGKQYADKNGPQFVAVCECYYMHEAEMIAAALNVATPASGGPRE